MLASWNWLAEFVDLSQVGGPKALAELMTRRGLEVEGIRSLAQGFEKVVTVKILERKRHPEADRLSICQVTTGKGDPLEIVCGAQNMKAGDTVALAQIGALLPNGLKIEASKIRGVLSHGMLCSEEELKLKEKSEGILILPPATPLGRPLAEILGLDDTLFDFNLTPNRGDCLSHIGLAREIAAATNQKLKRMETTELKWSGCPVKTVLDAGDAALQFLGCFIEGVKVGPSPDWLVKRLTAIGARSINNVVDCSNWVLHELGQPTHAYDADKLMGTKAGAGIELHARMARKGEKLLLLDDKEVTLQGTELVIADLKGPVGLAGVMGGGVSAVSEKTTRVFLECAEFAPVLVRKAAFFHQRRSEASLRFEKGVDPAGLTTALARLAFLIQKTAGGKIVGSTATIGKTRDPKTAVLRKSISLAAERINEILGISLSQEALKAPLVALGCEIEAKGSAWKVTVPSYRLDLSIPEDLAEEVARSIGYDQIPSTIPTLSTSPDPLYGSERGLQLELIDRAKDYFVRAGFCETIQFSFNSRAWLSQFGIESAIPVLNPLSEEQEVLIPSLLPGMIQQAVRNWNHHFGSEPLAIRLFELRPTFMASGPLQATDENTTGALENWKLAFLLSGPRFAEGLRTDLSEVDFSDFKAVLEGLFQELGARGVRIRAMAENMAGTVPKLLHPFQSVEVVAGKDVVGWFGQVHPKLARKHKFRSPVWMGEVDWKAVSKLSRTAASPPAFKAWSEFPGIERDFALLVKDRVTGDQLVQVALKTGKPLVKQAKVFDIYRGQQVAPGMTSIAVRVIFLEESRSLREEEADQASQKILSKWKEELGVELRT